MNRVVILKMAQAFKKKKQQTSPQDLPHHLNFLLGSQLLQPSSTAPTVLERSLILKSAMFWDSRNRIERIKSLVLSNLKLGEFDDVQDFKIGELTSIRQLSLSKNELVHLHPISVLDTLVTLNVSHNRIYNLTPLQPLLHLEEFFASNNQIANIDPLKTLTKLRIIKVYHNKIANISGTFSALEQLSKLEDLDIEQNPVYSEETRKRFVSLPITRLNDQLISKAEKEGATSIIPIKMTASCLINSLSVSMMRDTKTSFFHSSSKASNKLQQLRERYESAQNQYTKIDDEFEEEIAKNVHLKTEFHRANQKKKEAEQLREDYEFKTDQIKDLKRKAKTLKQNLFTKDRKGQLLRQLFELETRSSKHKSEAKSEIKKKVIWSRRFESDDFIVIAEDRSYFQEDQQLAELLASNSDALQELKKELQSLY